MISSEMLLRLPIYYAGESLVPVTSSCQNKNILPPSLSLQEPIDPVHSLRDKKNVLPPNLSLGEARRHIEVLLNSHKDSRLTNLINLLETPHQIGLASTTALVDVVKHRCAVKEDISSTRLQRLIQKGTQLQDSYCFASMLPTDRDICRLLLQHLQPDKISFLIGISTETLLNSIKYKTLCATLESLFDIQDDNPYKTATTFKPVNRIPTSRFIVSQFGGVNIMRNYLRKSNEMKGTSILQENEILINENKPKVIFSKKPDIPETEKRFKVVSHIKPDEPTSSKESQELRIAA